MESRFLEILLFLAERFHRSEALKWELEEAARFLHGQGYDSREITAAISWFFLQVEPRSTDLPALRKGPRSLGVRVLREAERRRFSPSGYGYLLQLRHLGILDDLELEAIVEAAMQSDLPVIDEEAVKAIVSTLLCADAEGPDPSGDLGAAMGPEILH